MQSQQQTRKLWIISEGARGLLVISRVRHDGSDTLDRGKDRINTHNLARWQQRVLPLGANSSPISGSETGFAATTNRSPNPSLLVVADGTAYLVRTRVQPGVFKATIEGRVSAGEYDPRGANNTATKTSSMKAFTIYMPIMGK